jgi:hypothetical protein
MAAPDSAIVPLRIDRDGDPMETAIRAGRLPAPAKLTVPVVAMGDGVTGWRSYNAALGLRMRGYPTVLWYRGGEEAWAHGTPTREQTQHGRNDLESHR